MEDEGSFGLLLVAHREEKLFCGFGGPTFRSGNRGRIGGPLGFEASGAEAPKVRN
jgi:hypothetical protein